VHKTARDSNSRSILFAYPQLVRSFWNSRRISLRRRFAWVMPTSQLVQEILKRARTVGMVINIGAKLTHRNWCNWLRKKEIKDQKPGHYWRKCFGSLAVADQWFFNASKLIFGHSSIMMTARAYAGQVDKLPAVKFWHGKNSVWFGSALNCWFSILIELPNLENV